MVLLVLLQTFQAWKDSVASTDRGQLRTSTAGLAPTGSHVQNILLYLMQ